MRFVLPAVGSSLSLSLSPLARSLTHTHSLFLSHTLSHTLSLSSVAQAPTPLKALCPQGFARLLLDTPCSLSSEVINA